MNAHPRNKRGRFKIIFFKKIPTCLIELFNVSVEMYTYISLDWFQAIWFIENHRTKKIMLPF